MGTLYNFWECQCASPYNGYTYSITDTHITIYKYPTDESWAFKLSESIIERILQICSFTTVCCVARTRAIVNLFVLR